MNWINQMETPVVRQEEKDEKKPKMNEKVDEKEKKVVKVKICVDHDSEASDEDYYDMSDSDSVEDLFEECKDELWKIE